MRNPAVNSYKKCKQKQNRTIFFSRPLEKMGGIRYVILQHENNFYQSAYRSKWKRDILLAQVSDIYKSPYAKSRFLITFFFRKPHRVQNEFKLYIAFWVFEILIFSLNMNNI